jgi:hypothetical protein
MSRHDKLIRQLREDPVMYLHAEAADALEEEIAAHDRTREERNIQTKHVGNLLDNVRGLAAKVRELEARTGEVAVCCETKTPSGWWCTRGLGHDGPCAAHETLRATCVACRMGDHGEAFKRPEHTCRPNTVFRPK